METLDDLTSMEEEGNEENVEEKEIKLFRPTDKDMKMEYPELDDIKEFTKLSGGEMRFVWYWANRTSPFYGNKNKKIKAQSCINASFKNGLHGNEYKRYMSGNFPDILRVAMEKMESYSPSIRMQAKMAIEKIFQNLQTISDMRTEDLIDLQSRKDYATLAVTVSKNMGDVVRQMENAYGVSYHSTEAEEKVSADKGPTMMDRLHMEDS